MIVKQGEIYLVNMNRETIGSEQAGTRPAVIIQNNVGNKYSTTTIVALLTTQAKKTKDGKEYPMHCPIHQDDLSYGNIEENSYVLCEQIYTIDKQRIIKKIGSVENNLSKLEDLVACIRTSLGIDKE